MKVEEVISRVAELCRQHDAQKVILYGSRAKGTALERSDIDIAVSGVKDFDTLSDEVTTAAASSRRGSSIQITAESLPSIARYR